MYHADRSLLGTGSAQVPTRGLLPIPRGPGPEIRSYDPPFRDKTIYWLARNLFGDDRAGVRSARELVNLLEILPGSGDAALAMKAKEAYDAAQAAPDWREEWVRRGEAGLLGGLAIAGALTQFGRPIARKAAAHVSRKATDIVGGIADKRAIADASNLATQQPARLSLAPPSRPAPTSIVQTPDLRTMSPHKAIRVARAEPHLIQQGGRGQYVGAPRGTTTTEDIQKNRARFDEHVEAGVSGSGWYAAGRAFNVASQPSRARQSEAARLQGIFSSQADPGPNLGWQIEASTARTAGRMPPIIRTGQQARTVTENLPLGSKTGVFAQHLDPRRPYATTGTNDIWHARAMGYTGTGGEPFNTALTRQEHRFIDYETMLAIDRANAKGLGGRRNWTAEELQASAWVAIKGRDLARRRGLTEAEGIRIASRSFPDYAPKFTVSVPTEQISGEATGLLPGLHDASAAAKAQFSREATWAPPGRADTLLDYGGPALPTQRGVGVYRNKAGLLEFNPVEVHRPLTSFKTGGGARYIPDYMTEGLDASAAVRGLIDMQEGSSWNKVITHSTGPFTAFNLNTARMPTRSQMERAIKVSENHNINVIANADGGLAFNKFADVEKGATVKEVAKATQAAAREVNKLLKGSLGNDLRKIFKDAEFVRGTWAGGYIDLSYQLALKHAGKGYGTKKVLRQLDRLRRKAPGFYEKLINSTGPQIKARKNLERYNRWLGKLGDQQRDDYVKLLEIVGTSKIKGLIDYVKKYGAGGLPAIALAALSPGLRDEGDGTGSESTAGRI